MIPDHEVLRKIGGGAYGEVWLARGVTGAMRAVKIVYREDFSDERTFEREFEGILRFEPISRDHRGFVNILHVGRSEGESEFYYYVMELGDDAHSDGEINAVEYEPRTLRTDMKRAPGTPLGTQFCIETGRRLAEALAELHHRGLTHRDVKPSNVIFVEGKAKLADIGLVAAKDQRTFVGTEGFVPPEGPGSEGADIYSLGKVLYEMATGMDRLQFPELPEGGPGDDHRKKWIRLNRLICDICDPRVSKRKITTGNELAGALDRLLAGKKVVKKVPAPVKWAFAILALGLFLGSQIWVEKTWGTHIIEGKREPLPPKFVTVRILSNPPGADVLDEEGNRIDITPATIRNVKVDSTLNLVLKAEGYREEKITEVVRDDGDGTKVDLIERDLNLFSPPKIDEIWEDALGNTYLPDGERHESSQHVSFKDWEIFRKEVNEKLIPIKFKYDDTEIVAVKEEWAQQYAEWLMNKCIREGYFEEYSEETLENNREIIAQYDLKFPENRLPGQAKKGGKVIRPFHCVVRLIPYGTLTIESTPPGAVIYLSDGRVKVTPDTIICRPGWVEWTVELGGHKTEGRREYLSDGGERSHHLILEKNKSVDMGKPWTNGLDMDMVPLGDELMIAVWETRTVDFDRYLKSEKIPAGQLVISVDPNHPVVGVTREECERFCEWLTRLERKGERIKKDYQYRLPTDEEWSRMVDLIEVGSRPEDRALEVMNEGKFPWGSQWPPPAKAGNFADASAGLENLAVENTISGYDDGYPRLAPVGQFSPNILGIHDLAGNVHEWVSSNYKGLGLVRGGSWKSFTKDKLESKFRYPVDVEWRDETFGFRVVLAKEPEEELNILEIEDESNGGDSD
ncbi:SUMF1/EgtB/PvdO family nonheme iron enzyme [Verrucomicrobiaceae bacterium 227]